MLRSFRPSHFANPLPSIACPASRGWARCLSSDDRKRKAVFVAGTMQHHGKTTITLGMVHALVEQGRRVAYQKPVGQQTVPVQCDGATLEIDRDVDVFKHLWPKLVGSFADSSPVAFPPAFTRYVLDGKETPDVLRGRCVASFERLLHDAEYVVVEGTGHIGVGSIVGLNNAQARAVLQIQSFRLVNLGALLLCNSGMVPAWGISPAATLCDRAVRCMRDPQNGARHTR